MRDRIPPRSHLAPRTGFILNLDTSDGEGTHWTAVLYVRPKRTAAHHGSPSSASAMHMCYYDSYGFPPPQEIVDEYGDMLYNTHNHQPYDSATCGWYCAYVLDRCLRKNKTFLDVVYGLRPGSGESMDEIGDSDNDDEVIDAVLRTR